MNGLNPHEAAITACANEPIHIPGRIQPNGVLLAIQMDTARISQVSANCRFWLGASPDSIIGMRLDEVIPKETAYAIGRAAEDGTLRDINPIPVSIDDRLLEGVAHVSGGVIILEFEAVRPDEARNFTSFHNIVRRSLERLQRSQSLGEACDVTVEEVRRITAFDRVMVYRFDPEWNGEVIAEDCCEDMDPYLGLRYPASDIPKQARDLYTRNWLRLVSDVDYCPVPILPENDPVTGRPLDLSGSVLRSVSPVHIEYLKNMGVGASMSISIIHEGKLWGLIACHHETARPISYEIRSACEFLGQALSIQLTAKEDLEANRYAERLRAIRADLETGLDEADDISAYLTECGTELMALLNARGVAICMGDHPVLIGECPSEGEVGSILDWVLNQHKPEIVATECLTKAMPEAGIDPAIASGVAAITLGQAQRQAILWFRPEVVRTVNWAGNPEKPAEMEGARMVLHPRKSFELWKEAVHGRSAGWKASELAVAQEFRASLLAAIVGRTAKNLRVTVDELNESYAQLDSFAYIVSHDLKEPLRGIRQYVDLITEEYGDAVGADGLDLLGSVHRLSGRMDNLISALLRYSRVGRADVAEEQVDLNEVLVDVRDALSSRIRETGATILVPERLPAVKCDRVLAGEIFQNLISNGLKYNDKPDPSVQVGCWEAGSEEAVRAMEGASQTDRVYYVKDNGIGIAPRHFDQVFGMFRRLHGRDQYGGGTGAGLAIVKRIVERSGGQIRLDSVVGEGTAFYFTLGWD